MRAGDYRRDPPAEGPPRSLDTGQLVDLSMRIVASRNNRRLEMLDADHVIPASGLDIFPAEARKYYLLS